MTAITDVAPLLTSRIIPRRVHATNVQRVGVHNRLLLFALWDAAFDEGLVTFSDEGAPVFSQALSGDARRELRWNAVMTLTRR